jgi:hypothetical protein
MTVSTTSPVVTYSGNGGTTAFAVPFQFLAASDLVVTEISSAGVETTKALTTHYTVSGGSGSTGTVTMVAAPASGTGLRIHRDTARSQLTDFVDGDELEADTLERTLDRLTMQVQELKEREARSFQGPRAGGALGPAQHAPALADRAGRLVVWGSSGGLGAYDGDAGLGADLTAYDAFLATAGAVARSFKGKGQDHPDVRDYGARSSESSAYANANSAAFALAAEENPGRPVFVPPGYFCVDDETVLQGDGAGFFGVGMASQIEQVMANLSVFQVRDTEHNVIRDIRFVNDNAKAVISGSYESEPARERAAAVYANGASHLLCRGLRVKGFVVGIRLRANDPLTDICSYNRVIECEFDHYDFGVLATNQAELLLYGLTGDNCDFSQPSAPPHLIYCAGDETTDRVSKNIIAANCLEKGNAHSSSYKFRNIDGLGLANLWSRDCPRGTDLVDVDGFVVSGGGVLGLLSPSATDTQRACIVADGVRRGIISGYHGTLVDDLDDANGIFIRNSSNRVLVVSSRIKCKRTSASSSYVPFRADSSDRITFLNNEAVEDGANKFLFRITGGDRCRIVHPITRNAGGGRVAQIDGGATNVYVRLDRALIENASTSGEVDSSGAGSGLQLVYDGAFGTFPPLASAPANVPAGTLAISDGTGGGFDGASGAGLYRRATTTWVFIG